MAKNGPKLYIDDRCDIKTISRHEDHFQNIKTKKMKTSRPSGHL